MKKIKIQLCLMGHQRYRNEIDKLRKYSSKLFEVKNCIEIKQLPNCNPFYWGYSDNEIVEILKSQKIDNSEYDLCMCFIDAPIEDNFFSRDLTSFDSKTVVCSFFGVEDIFKEKSIEFFNYLHGKVLYEVVQIATIHRVDENYFSHDDTRQCLFDMCGVKTDIVIKYSEPRLCSQCISKIEASAVDSDFIMLLQKEFKSFKKALFYRIIDFVKKKPLLSIVITVISTIVINIISSWLYELIKGLF